MNDNNAMCRIPVRTTMQRVNGEMVMTAAEWADIPADLIARFLIEQFGLDAERSDNIYGCVEKC